MGRNRFGFCLGLIVLAAGLRLSYAYAPFAGHASLAPRDHAGPALVALLRPQDCGNYDGLIGLLNLAAERGATVTGLLVDERGRQQSGGVAGLVNPIAFPLASDPRLTRRFTRTMVRLGYRSTPLVVLVDEAGRVRTIVPPSADIVAHARAVHRLVETELTTLDSESR